MNQTNPSRRSALRLLGAAAVLGLSGCGTLASGTGTGTGGSPTTGPTPGPSTGPSTGTPPNAGPATGNPHMTVDFGVYGEVRDASGRPVADAFIEVVPLGNTPAVPDLAVMTDASGRYEWPLRAGRYLIRASHARGRAEGAVDVPAGGAARLDMILR